MGLVERGQPLREEGTCEPERLDALLRPRKRVQQRGVSLLSLRPRQSLTRIWQIWETVLHEIFNSPTRDIAEVWSFEAVQTGDSALLNMGKLGAICTFSHTASVHASEPT